MLDRRLSRDKTFSASKSVFSRFVISLIERKSLKDRVKTGRRTSPQKEMKTLTLIRLEDGTFIDKREHRRRRPPSTPDEAEVQRFLIMESRHYFSIIGANEKHLSDHRPFTTTSGRFGYGRESVEEGDILCILTVPRQRTSYGEKTTVVMAMSYISSSGRHLSTVRCMERLSNLASRNKTSLSFQLLCIDLDSQTKGIGVHQK